jgi:hypothetical protein
MYPKQGPGWLVVGASASAVDPKTHRKYVWAYVKAIAKLVDVVVSNITMSRWRWLWYFLGWRLVIHLAMPVLASIRKRKENVVKIFISFFIPVLTPPSPLPPQPQILFDSQKKGGYSQQLSHDSWWDWLPCPLKGDGNKRERICIPQVCREIHPLLQAGREYSEGWPGVDPESIPSR